MRRTTRRPPTAAAVVGRVGVGAQSLLLHVHVGQRQRRCGDHVRDLLGEFGVGGDHVDVEQAALRAALGLVLLGQGGGDLLVVALDRLERLVGDTFGEQSRGGADQGVADLDVRVEEVSGRPGSRPPATATPWPVRRPGG